jgi:putative ATP-binding cassette transporter
MLNLLRRIGHGLAAIPKASKTATETTGNLINVLKPFFVAKETRATALLYVAGIIALLFASGWINVKIAHATSYWMNSIQGQPFTIEDWLLGWVASWPQWLGFSARNCWLIILLLLLCLITPIQAYGNRFQAWLAVDWRKFMANLSFDGYFSWLSWLRMESNAKVDAPDQRMTDNTRDFTSTSVVLAVAFISALINMIVYTPDLMHISVGLTIGVYVWALFVSGTSIWIGKPMVAQNNRLNEMEAALRFHLQEVRREAEAIAFARGEQIAQAAAVAKQQAAIDAQKAIILRNFLLQLFTTPVNGLVPWLAPIFLGGVIAWTNGVSFGTILAAGLDVGWLYGALSVVVNQFPLISAYLAFVKRISALQEALKDYSKHPLPSGGIKIADGDDIVLEQLTLGSKDGKTEFVSKLDLVLKKGERLCVIADDAAARTEVARLLDRLTATGSGKMQAPQRKDVMVLAEIPYLPEASLRAVVASPCADCGDDEAILNILKQTGLSRLIKRCGGLDAVQNWRGIMKLSELQRLSFARALFQNPGHIVIAGGMSSLPSRTKDEFYGMLHPDKTVVTITSDESLVKYHQRVLTIASGGTWEIHQANEHKPKDSKAELLQLSSQLEALLSRDEALCGNGEDATIKADFVRLLERLRASCSGKLQAPPHDGN